MPDFLNSLNTIIKLGPEWLTICLLDFGYNIYTYDVVTGEGFGDEIP